MRARNQAINTECKIKEIGILTNPINREVQTKATYIHIPKQLIPDGLVCEGLTIPT
jgi:hypothetical protein